jgi:hypothetical protein
MRDERRLTSTIKWSHSRDYKKLKLGSSGSDRKALTNRSKISDVSTSWGEGSHACHGRRLLA